MVKRREDEGKERTEMNGGLGRLGDRAEGSAA